jgi:hypothetical protein
LNRVVPNQGGYVKVVALVGNYAYLAGWNGLDILRLSGAELQITRSAGQVIVSWPASASGFLLDTAPALRSGTIWSPLPDGAGVLGSRFMVTNNASAGSAFFRLRQP